MESIGKHLRESREQRGLTIDQVSRETNISRHYLVALEEDRYDAFPAEPYVIGFLRNYSEHLGLDSEALIGKFRTLRIQEQPAPLEELIRKPSPWPLRILWGGGALIVLLILGFLIVPPVVGFFANLPQTLASAGPERQPKVYTFAAKDKTLVQRLYVGDSVAVELNGQTVSLPLTAIGDDTALGDYRLHLGDEVFVDLEGDGVQDLRVFLKDVTPTDPRRGAEFALERLAPPTGNLAAGAGTPGDEVKPGMAAAGSASAAAPEDQKPVVIMQDVPTKPFTMDVVFRGYALFRYVVDDNRREENYFRKGDTIRIEASRKVKIWVSNAGAFSGKVNAANDFEVGRPGEVVARSIEWSKDAAGKTILVANPMN
jgi:cytoskeletal protein RodZ